MMRAGSGCRPPEKVFTTQPQDPSVSVGTREALLLDRDETGSVSSIADYADNFTVKCLVSN